MNPSSRRTFLRTALAAGVAPLLLPARARGAAAPSNRRTQRTLRDDWQRGCGPGRIRPG